MKAKLHRLKLTKAEREILNRQIKEEMLQMNAEYEHSFDIILAYVLNVYLGFGRKRYKRLYNHIIDERLKLRRFYSDDECSDDKIDIFYMEKALKKRGIVVQEILDEIMRERTDDIRELNGGGYNG